MTKARVRIETVSRNLGSAAVDLGAVAAASEAAADQADFTKICEIQPSHVRGEAAPLVHAPDAGKAAVQDALVAFDQKLVR